ncbi:inorganic phosphate transporter [Clostridium sp. SHJSY1]|uniref:inorganic phosphate transporter n=1 Tax=Clostridium sp. SHJSY1 TaxID=2942483 RepID=UPI0028764548|nr:inorganic phosphate transporter [Clostridium sp. SHJSY1]MDS0527782.1 inorganic phosphate transporter [Clostridium sp. SHJSY1]
MHNAVLITTLIVIFTLIFDFINGFHDTATAVATTITTKALNPRRAIILCAIFNFIGAFTGTAVAKTVGSDIVTGLPQWVILCVLISAIIWNLFTWYFGIPSSSSHALIGALVGGGIAYFSSFGSINWQNLLRSVVLWLFLSPVIGLAVGYILMTILNFILKPFKISVVNRIFLRLQVLAGAFMSLNHGGNDAQKSMGIITMALISGGFISSTSAFHVPLWVIASCALAMALGTSLGGKKIIKTMGSGVTKLTPVSGFASQLGAASVILTASLFHAPVSTTHIATTTIMGVGSSKSVKSVKWGVAKSILWAWVLTIPITAIISAILIYIVKLFI